MSSSLKTLSISHRQPFQTQKGKVLLVLVRYVVYYVRILYHITRYSTSVVCMYSKKMDCQRGRAKNSRNSITLAMTVGKIAFVLYLVPTYFFNVLLMLLVRGW